MKTIRINLMRRDSIKKAIDELEKYKNRLDDKAKDFVEALADIGIFVINARVGNISSFYKGNDLSVQKSALIQTDNGWECAIVMSGSQCVFVEFGSGITFNTAKGGSKHPKGGELGFTIGSYNPPSPNATNPSGWWYYDQWGQSQHTYGTPTFAPMYAGSLEMIQAIESVARKVFK